MINHYQALYCHNIQNLCHLNSDFDLIKLNYLIIIPEDLNHSIIIKSQKYPILINHPLPPLEICIWIYLQDIMSKSN